jgi:hypothetical protein
VAVGCGSSVVLLWDDPKVFLTELGTAGIWRIALLHRGVAADIASVLTQIQICPSVIWPAWASLLSRIPYNAFKSL